MACWALLFLAVYLLLCFGVRSVVQKARTGSTGFKGISGKVGSTEWVGGVLFAVALALGALAPILDLASILGPIATLNTELAHAAGGGLFFGGLISTVIAQAAMGDSWRIGVDHQERTELVTDGPFAYVRNPVFAGMIPVGIGIALLVPSVVAILAVVLLIAALQIQTRLVEEPYLLATHGDKYARYADRVGRFFPRVGRL
jgi:protein-S-isoprenylcysteine O-methyltransferase Ste14